MEYHIIAFVAGFLLDLCLGDPYWLPHPIRAIGTLIAKLTDGLLKENLSNRKKRWRGVGLVALVLICTEAVVVPLLIGAYMVHPVAGCVVETVMTYQMLATKCLKVESRKVYDAIEKEGLPQARKAVSMIVGRDTQQLTEEGVIKAAVETVAENTSDGIIAPMLYLAIGGPIAGFFYKSINTMDSMVGYKNERFYYFGTAAAKLDDVVNYLPARISAYLMIVSCTVLGSCYHTKDAYRIYKRDRYQHKSPNSAHTESVCAGALGVQLAGDASYFGKRVQKPYIGDRVRPIEAFDIVRANRLLYATAILCEGICAGGLLAVWYIL
ncbi:adenosylcobinamide-phosphate synthase [Lachnospiraceae bacterium XBB1006]|nr:adenosylcobinamide-phosphate synthase [Lachnospiraceae bacterium XBB1006]